MKIETKKIIAKEILILIICIILPIIFCVSLNINNSYQKNQNKILNTELIDKNKILDSIIKPLTEYNLLCEHYRFNIYNQFGTLNRYQIPKLPKGYKLDQKIGEIDKWDKYIINNIDEDKANKLLNFNFENFSKKLKDSTNYRKIVYERLKIYFNDSDCNNFSIFESKIGINTPNQIKEIQINVNRINKESEIIKNKINTTINWFVDDPNISKFSLYFFYTLFAFVFILRYLFYIIKWSVNTLKLKQ